LNYRHEWKHEINYADRLILLARLNAVFQKDEHAVNGSYKIRSLYFDSPTDKALREKQDGVDMREKYRIRYYNNDTSFITLEKKSKIKGLCNKFVCEITKEEAQRLVDGDYEWMKDDTRPLCVELYYKIYSECLRPRTVVDYQRDPYVYAPGNVRIAIDYNIRTGLNSTDFLNPELVTLPAGDAPMILEVKWDEYLPDIVKDVVTLPGRRVGSFSKYEQCRIYG